MRWEPARSQRCACQQQQLSRPDRRHVAQTVRFCATRRAPWLAQRALAAATVENRRLQQALDHLEPVAEARLERLRDAGAAKVQAADTARADERKAWAALTDAATTVRDDKKRARLQVEQLARSQAALQHCEATADRQHQLQQLAIKTKHRTELAAARLRVAGLQADVRTLQRHNREMARATAEAAEPVVVRVATPRGNCSAWTWARRVRAFAAVTSVSASGQAKPKNSVARVWRPR